MEQLVEQFLREFTTKQLANSIETAAGGVSAIRKGRANLDSSDIRSVKTIATASGTEGVQLSDGTTVNPPKDTKSAASAGASVAKDTQKVITVDAGKGVLPDELSNVKDFLKSPGLSTTLIQAGKTTAMGLVGTEIQQDKNANRDWINHVDASSSREAQDAADLVDNFFSEGASAPKAATRSDGRSFSGADEYRSQQQRAAGSAQRIAARTEARVGSMSPERARTLGYSV
jgi:hypothetical protein